MTAVVGAALALFAWAMVQSTGVLIGVAIVISVVCAAAIARMRAAATGVAMIVAFSFTASWDQAAVAGLKPRLIFLVLGLLLLLTSPEATRVLTLPWWVHAYGIAAGLVTVAQLYFPPSAGYLASRYLTSSAGLALGSRPGAVPALASLLVNIYAVPMAVVLACAVSRQALKRIIAAYVAGAALSNLAAFLGFEGVPVLLKVLVVPPPAGVRALGYTSHPLHLATSGVMAVGLACWLAVLPSPALRWTGRLSLLALVLGLFASGSRGGNAAALAVLALCAVLLPAIRRRIHAVAAVAGIAVAAVIALAPSIGTTILRTTRIYGGLTSDASNDGRGQVLDQSIVDFMHYPVYGIGVQYSAEAHVLYSGVLASGGVILALAFLVFTYGSLATARHVMLRDPAMGGAILATLVGSLLYWVVADDFQVASVQIVYGVLLASMLANRMSPYHRAAGGSELSADDRTGVHGTSERRHDRPDGVTASSARAHSAAHDAS